MNTKLLLKLIVMLSILSSWQCQSFIRRSSVISHQLSSRAFSSTSISAFQSIKPNVIYTSDEQIIKKSKFVGLAKQAKTFNEAQLFINEVKEKLHPKARHWCYAFVGSDDSSSSPSSSNQQPHISSQRIQDDGEPSGTAGQPIYSAITQSNNLTNTVVVVVRYYGGIKLGAGGLIRAYGGAARAVLDDVDRIVIADTVILVVKLEATDAHCIYDIVHRVTDCEIIEGITDGDRKESIIVEVARDKEEMFRGKVMEGTSGRGEVIYNV